MQTLRKAKELRQRTHAWRYISFGLTNLVKEVGWCFRARRCAGLISTRPLLFTGSDRTGNQSAALLSTLAHISTNTGAVFSPKPARGWNAIELYHSAGKANLHKPSCRVYQRESRPREADCTPSFSLEETRPDSHLIGICLSQPGEQAVPTGVSHTNCNCSMSLIIRPSEKMPKGVTLPSF